MVVFLCVGPVPTHGQNTAWLRNVLQRKHSQNRQKAALLTGARGRVQPGQAASLSQLFYLFWNENHSFIASQFFALVSTFIFLSVIKCLNFCKWTHQYCVSQNTQKSWWCFSCKGWVGRPTSYSIIWIKNDMSLKFICTWSQMKYLWQYSVITYTAHWCSFLPAGGRIRYETKELVWYSQQWWRHFTSLMWIFFF